MSQILKNAAVPVQLLPAGANALDPVINPIALVDIEIENNQIISISNGGSSEEVSGIDLNGDILIPGFIDSHTHLDKAHTWNRAPNRSGTFAEAIETLSKDKENWTESDLYLRANTALKSAFAYGTTALRTHIDTGHPGTRTSYEVMQKLKAEWKGRIELQYVSLCGVEGYSEANGKTLADIPVEYGASALGGMPQMNANLPKQLDRLMAMASERQVGLDLHVDESLNPNANCLKEVALAVLRNEFTYPVACGHCCSLTILEENKQRETLDLIRESKIDIISLPLCNLYLQDRETPKTPIRRGITLINELSAQGNRVACASDNIRDAFYAYGDLDMFEVYLSSLRIGHLDNNLGESIKSVTSLPAEIIGLPKYGRIEVDSPAQFIRFEAKSFSELLSRPMQKRKRFVDGEFQTIDAPDYEEIRSI